VAPQLSRAPQTRAPSRQLRGDTYRGDGADSRDRRCRYLHDTLDVSIQLRMHGLAWLRGEWATVPSAGAPRPPPRSSRRAPRTLQPVSTGCSDTNTQACSARQDRAGIRKRARPSCDRRGECTASATADQWALASGRPRLGIFRGGGRRCQRPGARTREHYRRSSRPSGPPPLLPGQRNPDRALAGFHAAPHIAVTPSAGRRSRSIAPTRRFRGEPIGSHA